MPVADTPSSSSLQRTFYMACILALATFALYWAQKVLIPVALALLLAFLLSPVVTWLQRRGLGRTVSVLLAVLLAFSILGGFGFVITSQLRGLLGQLPTYQANVAGKMARLRQGGSSSWFDNLQHTWQNVTELPQAGEGAAATETTGKTPTEKESVAPGRDRPQSDLDATPDTSTREPIPVQIVPTGFERVVAALQPAGEFLATTVLAVVLVIFMLLGREDLRNRVVRLVGPGQLVSTTRALDDAGSRISRYLLMQTVVNAGVGLAVAFGLYAIAVASGQHVPYALLWGFLAGSLRFIPYAGTWSVCALLTLFCVAAFPDWWHAAVVFGYFATLEILVSQAVEPLLFGHSTGVSPVALLVSAAFWTWLWGPVGLLMSIPLTSCLVVLGKYVPQLQFFDVLLGIEPVLDEQTRFYQRLLARDQDEATELVEDYLEKQQPETVYDTLLLPSLCAAKRDRERGELPLEDEHFVYEVTRSILDGVLVPEATAGSEAAGEQPSKAQCSGVLLLGCPARDTADELAMQMFQQLLAPAQCQMKVLPAQATAAEIVTCIREERPQLVLIAALPPGGLAQTLYLCKRLHRQFPEARIMVGRWGQKDLPERILERLRRAGAVQVATTLLESRSQLVPLMQAASGDGRTSSTGPLAASH